jgi:serine/threonine protein kinase
VARYVESARIEAEILERVQKLDTGGASRCVHLVDHFTFKRHSDKHYAIMFEVLGKSLFDIIKDNSYRGSFFLLIFTGFSISLVRSFARQLFESLAFLHGIGLTHTDLKVAGES